MNEGLIRLERRVEKGKAPNVPSLVFNSKRCGWGSDGSGEHVVHSVRPLLGLLSPPGHLPEKVERFRCRC